VAGVRARVGHPFIVAVSLSPCLSRPRTCDG
jgi:hypothetical protein